jgi:glutathione S-transferase
MKLFIGNKAYSSWSMRGWLAAKQSGLLFEEVTVPLYDEAWHHRREGAEFAPSSGKVPILWDGDAVVWDSLAIIDWLADRTERDLFWPADDAPRAAARSMAAEMHSSFVALRRECPMNVRRRFPPRTPSPEVAADVERIVTLWAQARARWGGGGDYLFGAWGAADIMFAPVVTRFVTWSLPVPRFAVAYGEAVLAHPDVAEWIGGAREESWVIDRYEQPAGA